MRFSYRKNFVLEKKLKIFLTIFLLVLISSLGYIISKDAFASGTKTITVTTNWVGDNSSVRPDNTTLHVVGDVTTPYEKVAIVDWTLVLDYVCENGSSGSDYYSLKYVKVSDEEANSWDSSWNLWETSDSDYRVNLSIIGSEIQLRTNADVIKIRAYNGNLEFFTNYDGYQDQWNDISDLVKFDLSEITSMANLLNNDGEYDDISSFPTDYSWMNGLDRTNISAQSSNYVNMLPYIEGETVLPDWYDGTWSISEPNFFGGGKWASFVPNQAYNHDLNPYAIKLGNTTTEALTPVSESEWTKAGNKWTKTIEVSADYDNIRVYEDSINNYQLDSASNNPKSIVNNAVTLTNTYAPKIKVTKKWYDGLTGSDATNRSYPEISLSYGVGETETFNASLDFNGDVMTFNSDSNSYVVDSHSRAYLGGSITDTFVDAPVYLCGADGQKIVNKSLQEIGFDYDIVEQIISYMVDHDANFRIMVGDKISGLITPDNTPGIVAPESDGDDFGGTFTFTIENFETNTTVLKTSDDTTKWIKVNDDTWEYEFDVVLSDGYSIWESIVPNGYSTSNNSSNPVAISSPQNVTIQGVSTSKFAILYESGEMVFQIGPVPDPTKGNVVATYTGFENTLYDELTYVPWYSNLENITSIDFKDEIQPSSTKNFFSGMINLETISNMNNLDTSNVQNMVDMFKNCSSLTSLDLSHFDTSSAVAMSSLFDGCTSLETLDLSYFNTSNVTGMYRMFNDCSGLTTLDLSNFITNNVNTMQEMFSGCTELVTLDISHFNTGNVNNMYMMFNNCKGLIELNLNHFNTEKVTNMQNMFKNCNALETLNISNFDTGLVNNMYSMFCGCSSLSELDVSSFDTTLVTNMNSMFFDCSSLTSLNLNDFSTINVTNMNSMFKNCSNLEILKVDNFNTGKVSVMFEMFAGCSSLTTLDLLSFDVSGVNTMQSMFNGCSSLESLNLNNFFTTSLQNSYQMFNGCSNLRELDIGNFYTTNVTNMNAMFKDTDSLIKLELGSDFEFSGTPALTKTWIRNGDSTVYMADDLVLSYDGSTMSGTYRAVERLSITESVKGDLADINKYFDFTIELTDNGILVGSIYPYDGSKSGNVEFINGMGSISLKHGESIYIYIPIGYDYTIYQDNDGYSLIATNNTGTLNLEVVAEFVDTLNGVTPTGIFLDMIPFIILTIFGISGLLLVKKFSL